jgi:hypothetical protein
MQIQNDVNQALNIFKKNTNLNSSEVNSTKKEDVEKKSLEQTINESAVKVNISMNAQYTLFAMNTSSLTKENSVAQASVNSDQQEVLDFLSGKDTTNGLNLKNIGYEGKPIIELTKDEAKELISENGFFGITQTSNRVANFVFSFSGDNLELLEKGREGIVQGFEDAKKLFGGELPEISNKTQERTLALIDEKINSLKNPTPNQE